MTREQASRYSWISLLGLALTLACTLGGFAVAGQIAADNDDAAVSGLIWGALLGVAVGGCVVGLALARWCRGSARGVPWLVSPGLMLGAPLLASAALNGETVAVLMPVTGLVLLSGITSEFARWASRASRRTTG
jgi:hypothetical protein